MKKLTKMYTWLLLLALMVGMILPASAESSDFRYPSGEWTGARAGTISSGTTGRISFTYGGSYEGGVSYGKPEGYGCYTFYSGVTRSGDFHWTQGLPLLMEKSKRRSGPHYNGADMRYTGMTLNGQPCGFGALDFADGGTFYGEFRDGTVCGRGVYVYHEPDSVTGQSVLGDNWKMVSRTGSSLGGNWYSGLTCNGYWEGFGMLCYDISYYIGEVKGQYCSGHGVYWCWDAAGDPSGSMYQVRCGHYVQGGLSYSCSHGIKFPASSAAVKIGSSTSGGGTAPSTPTPNRTCPSCFDRGGCKYCTGGRIDCNRCINGYCRTCDGWGYRIVGGKQYDCYCTNGKCSSCYGYGSRQCTSCGGSGRCGICGK